MDQNQLHIFFFPLMAAGHMIPIIDMAKLFALRGLKTTLITTHSNEPLISKTIQPTKDLGLDINVQILRFPSVEFGLPEGCDHIDFIQKLGDKGWEMVFKFWSAVTKLQEPLEKLLQDYNPNCLVSDMFLPWTTDAAAKFGIPRIVFHGTGFFSLCAGDCINLYQPHKQVSSDSEPFVIPSLPGDIKMTRDQLPDHIKQDVENNFTRLVKDAKDSELKSFGVVVNSFCELEPGYVDFYRNVLGKKAWHIGPVSLCNRGGEDKVNRGILASIEENDCLKWLNSKKPNSVIYICFGSIANFAASQLNEIAIALEASGQNFIWVVKRNKKSEENEEEEEQEEDRLVEGFEKRMEGKGLIIRGWAPQVLILEHEAVGGFMTHCGWNSTIEGVSAGKPMVTWPVSAEQFYNEKLVTDVLKIGVGVGAKKWVRKEGDYVKNEAIGKAVNRVMGGEEAEEMRNRVRQLGEMAKQAVEESGSSYIDFNVLVEELRSYTP